MTGPVLLAAVGEVGEGFFQERTSGSLPCQAKPDQVFCLDWAREHIDRFGTPTLQHVEIVLLSVLLGFAIAYAAVRLSQDPSHPVSPVLGPWTLALPLIDCVVLILRRVRQGRSPFSADRQHMHHLLLDAGFGVAATVVLLGSLSLLLGLGAAIALKLGAYRPLLVLLFFVLIAGWFLFTRDHALAVARLSRLHPSSWRRDVTA